MSSVDTRNLERDSMFLMADLAIEGGEAIGRVKVRNLSAGGMMAEGDVPVSPGQRIEAELRNIGAISGTVAWVQGNKFGVAFAREIDPKLARTAVSGNDREAPRYARSALSAPRHDGWSGKLRRV
ncbi:MAG: PilZ domain-containing protein [Altererythrobacter sp.]|nr:PilZ domain-containing protein [Altererythrobacter sp.]